MTAEGLLGGGATGETGRSVKSPGGALSFGSAGAAVGAGGGEAAAALASSPSGTVCCCGATPTSSTPRELPSST